MGVSFPALLTAEIVRFRRLAEAATPELTEWQWGLLAHVLSGIEMHRIISGDDELPGRAAIIAEIDTWADSATDEDTLRASELRRLVETWSPLAIAGVFLRLRQTPS